MLNPFCKILCVVKSDIIAENCKEKKWFNVNPFSLKFHSQWKHYEQTHSPSQFEWTFWNVLIYLSTWNQFETDLCVCQPDSKKYPEVYFGTDKIFLNEKRNLKFCPHSTFLSFFLSSLVKLINQSFFAVCSIFSLVQMEEPRNEIKNQSLWRVRISLNEIG